MTAFRKTSALRRTGILLLVFSLFVGMLCGCSAGKIISARIEPSSESITLAAGSNEEFLLSAQNNTRSDKTVRAVLMLSVLDSLGEPLFLNGSSTTQSAIDLLDGHYIVQRKAIQGHQAVYVLNPVVLSSRVGETASMLQPLQLAVKENAGSQYLSATVLLDLFIQTENPKNGFWETVDTDSLIISQTQVKKSKYIPKLPELTNTATYNWELRNGKACLTGIGSVTETDLVIPAQVMLRASGDGFVENPINGTSYPVQVCGNAFADCDFITSVTFTEGVSFVNDSMCTDDIGTFAGCDNLKAVYQIPNSVTTMRNTFAGCAQLEQVPSLPERLTDLSGCFSGCTALHGTVTLPHSVLDLKHPQAVQDTFMNCPKLESVLLDSCIIYPYAEQITDASVTYMQEHIEDGQCPYCQTVTCTTIIDGLEVVFDRVHSAQYEEYSAYIDTELSQKLKDACTRLTITIEPGRYYEPYYSRPEIIGFTLSANRSSFVVSTHTQDAQIDVLIHELAHCFDRMQGEEALVRNSEEWRALQTLEGDIMSSIYDTEDYQSVPDVTQRGETFAGAVLYYFTDPLWLLENCPNMYAYIDTLMEDEL